ncbi:MAG: disulfide bond formation protein B [Pseudomonadales bacterium]|nr:disulfide bond formation protein B [Pseudomonadales bacterium]MBO6566178.1 disulfide bond formation protein B [Pseudomonadales bacterium]MBO6596540.1 disulfide bond formation protein B [Pseudomonadales bacterium]MBO6657580.1 disulfide bond formation protein B [Pseudomonadales bacterium]MBO6703235.1 disulfide bond formation protein B [Pseudomonadales bacterium]
MLQYTPNPRSLYWLIAFGTVFLMSVALYMEHAMHLEPCPLCIFQRIAVIIAGLIALVAAIHNPGTLGVRIYGGMVVASCIAGAGLSARQLHLQSLPEDQVPACGPGLDYLMDVFPMQDVIRMVLEGDGSCAEVVWTFLGLSIPGWTLLGFIGLIILGLFQILRPAQEN